MPLPTWLRPLARRIEINPKKRPQRRKSARKLGIELLEDRWVPTIYSVPGDFATIQAAISGATSGDTIQVAAGTFSESDHTLVIDKSLTLSGPNSAISPNTGTRGAEAIITSQGTDDFNSLNSVIEFTGTGLNVTIEGFEFDGTGPINDYQGSNTLTFSKNIFHNAQYHGYYFETPGLLTFDDNRFDGGDYGGEDSIQVGVNNLAPPRPVAFTNNVWTGVTTAGLNLSDVSGSVTGNQFLGNPYYGVLVANASGSLSITGNTFDGITNPGGSPTWGAGVRFYDPNISSLVSVTGNTFENSHIGVSFRVGSNITGMPIDVSGNTFTNNDYAFYHDGTGDLDTTTGNIYDGVDTSSPITTAQLLAIEDNIYDYLDDATKGTIIVQTGTTIVPPGGDVQTAIDSASSGDTILIADGTTTGSLTLPTDVTLAAQGDVTIGGDIDNNGNDLTLSALEGYTLDVTGMISDSGGLNVSGGGTVILSGNNDYTGPTVVDSGATLSVNGSITSDVTNNGTLHGSGTITGNVTGSGTFSPGNSPGIQNIVGNFTPAGTVTFDVNSPWTVAGTDFDQYVVSGTVDLSGATLSFINTFNAVPLTNTSLTIIDNQSAFPTIASSSPAEGSIVTIGSRSFYIFYNGGDGNDVVLVEASTPATVYVDDSWAGFNDGQSIADADPVTGGSQFAVYGVTAFSSVTSALGAVTSSGTVYVNDGSYASDAVNLTGTQIIKILGTDAVTAGSVTFGSLAGSNTTEVDTGTTGSLANSLSEGGLGVSTTFAGIISGPGSLTVTGGTLILSGLNSYTGDTTVSGGTLVINGSITSDVDNSGTLNGTGTITGNVSGNGNFSPGNSPGIMHIVGNLTPTGTVTFEVNSIWTTAGTHYDQYVVSGTVDLSGATLSFVNNFDASAPAANTLLTLIDKTSGGATVASASPAEGSLVTIGSRSFYLFYNGEDGNNVVLVEGSTPGTVYVDDAWAAYTGGTVIIDADPVTALNQGAIFGVTAFSTVSGGLTAASSSGVVYVNDGNYSADAANLTNSQKVSLLGTAPATPGSVTIGSLAGTSGTEVDTGATGSLANALTVGPLFAVTTFSGVISGLGSLTLSGGILTLDGPSPNTYSGLTHVMGGFLHLDKSTGPAVAGDLTAESGTSVAFHADNQTASTTNVTLNSATLYVGLNPTPTSTDTIGSLSLFGSTINIGPGSVLKLNGDITQTSPSLSLIQGSGSLDLNGAIRTFTVPSLGILNVASSITGGVGGITLTGGGSLYLTGSSANTYTGLTDIVNGTLYMQKDPNVVAVPGDLTLEANRTANAVNDEQIGDTSTVTLNNFALLFIGSLPSGTTETIGGLNINGGTLVIGSNGDVKLHGDVTVDAGFISAVTSPDNGKLDLDVATARTFDVPFTSTLHINVPVTGVGGITKTGGGLMYFNDTSTAAYANTYTGTTTVEDGGLILFRSNAVTIAGDLVVGDSLGLSGSAFVNAQKAGQFGTILVNVNGPDGILLLSGFNATFSGLTGSDLGTGLGVIDLGAGAATLTIDVSGTNSYSYPERIQGTGSIIKNGTGAQEFAHGNSYFGTTTINNGDLIVSADGALGLTNSGTTVKTGGRLLFSAVNPLLYTTLEPVTLDGGTIDTTTSTVFAVVFQGPITLTAASAIQNTGGAGTQFLLTGDINNGGFDLNVQAAAGNTLDFGGAIGNSGGLTETNSGTVKLSGATPNSYTGTTTVNNGTLKLAKNSGVCAIMGDLVVGDGIGSAGSAHVNVEASGQFDPPAVTVNGPDGLLSLNGFDATFAGLSGTGVGVIDLGGATMTLDVSGTYSFPGIIQGAGNLIKDGVGSQELAHQNTYTGLTTINAGDLIVSADGALGTIGTGTTVEAGGRLLFFATSSPLNYASAEPVTLHGGTIDTATGTTQNITFAGPVTQTASSAIQNTGGTNTTFTLTANINNGGFDLNVASASGDTLELSRSITNSGGLIQTNSGTVLMDGSFANSYTGTTNVKNGTLRLNKSPGVVSIAGDLTVGDGVGLAGSALVNVESSGQIDPVLVTVNGPDGLLKLNGFAATFIGLSGTGVGVVDLGGATLTLDVAGSYTYHGIIQGAGNLIKDGSGTQELAHQNTYTGTTYVYDGTLAASAASAIPGTVVIGDGFGGPNTAVVSTFATDAIATSASVTINSDGLLNLNNNDQSIAGLFGVGNVSGGAGALTNTLTVTVATIDTFDGVISGGLSSTGLNLTKKGPGLFILTNTHTYTGTTDVIAGELEVDGQIGNGPVFVRNGAILGGDGTVTGLTTVKAGGEIDPGAAGGLVGTLNVPGGVTFEAGSIYNVDVGLSPLGDITNDLLNGGSITILAGNAQLLFGTSFSAYNGLAFRIVHSTTSYGAGVFQSGVTPMPEGSTVSLGGTLYQITYVAPPGHDTVITCNRIIDTWTGLGNNNLWSNPQNWAGLAVPGPGEALVFPANALQKFNINDLPAGFDVGEIDFTGVGGGYGIGGNPIQLDGGIQDYATGNNTVSLNATLNFTCFWINSGGATQEHTGAIQMVGTHTVFISDTPASSTTKLSGPISGSGLSIVKVALGTLDFSGAASNTYGGQTWVARGTLNLAKTNPATAIASGPLVIGIGSGPANSAIVNIIYDNQIGDTVPVTVNVDGAFNFGTSSDKIGDLTLNGGSVSVSGTSGGFELGGNITVNADATISQLLKLGSTTHTITVGSGHTLTLQGQIIGSGGLIINGPGAVRMTGIENYYTGTTTVNSGTLYLGKTNDGINENNAAVMSYGPLVVGDGVHAATVVYEGTDQLKDNQPVTVNAGSTVNMNNFGDAIGSLTLNGGTWNIGALGKLTLNGDITSTGTSSLTGGELYIKEVTRNVNVTSGQLTLSAHVTSIFNAGLNKTGLGTLVLGAAPSSITGLTVTNGTVRALNGATLVGLVMNGGTFAMGTSGSVGTVTTNQAVTLAASATFSAKLAANGVSDELIQTGGNSGISLGNSTLAVSLLYTPLSGHTYTILSSSVGITGVFANAQNGQIVNFGGYLFQIVYQLDITNTFVQNIVLNCV